MGPIFQWFGSGTSNSQYGVRNVNPDTGRGEVDPASIPLGYGEFWPLCADAVQMATLATREGTAETQVFRLEGELDDDFQARVDEAILAVQAAAIADANGSPWETYSPALAGESVTAELTFFTQVILGGVRVVGETTQYQVLIRWAPPFSSRAKIRAEIDGAIIDIVYSGSAGVTFGGVTRCIKRVPTDLSANDADWIADPAGPRNLIADTPSPTGQTKTAALVWHTLKRGEDFPA